MHSKYCTCRVDDTDGLWERCIAEDVAAEPAEWSILAFFVSFKLLDLIPGVAKNVLFQIQRAL